MRKEDLDCRQLQAIKAVLETDTKVLVRGGPGSGKTATALWTAREFLEQADSRPQSRVLFLTFSRSAVGQLMRRCPGVISNYESQVEILTFHALAYRLLQSFGRYAGYGTVLPSIQSEARRKLLGHNPSQLVYDDLLPGAIKLLRSPMIRELLSSRWQLIICDEVQDTNAEQWELLQILNPRKLLLLGDGNQMIYTFIPGVSPDRFAQICTSVDQVIELEPKSYRDPSGAIPALAEAVRARKFNDQAVRTVLSNGRLTVLRDHDSSMFLKLIASEVAKRPPKEIGIFAHSNAAVAEIADQLNAIGVDHVLVGIPEAHSEALCVMNAQCSYAAGQASWSDVCTALALFLTASVRGREAPELARAFIGEMKLPALITQALDQLQMALKAASEGSIGILASVAMKSWEGLRVRSGFRVWRQAVSHFRRLVSPLKNESVSPMTIARLTDLVERARMEALIDLDYSERGRVRLMNYHQTKGREADIVIHIYRDDDYFGNEREPFEELSRLLNVALSRARERVIVILPSNPHPLVEPFTKLA